MQEESRETRDRKTDFLPSQEFKSQGTRRREGKWRGRGMCRKGALSGRWLRGKGKKNKCRVSFFFFGLFRRTRWTKRAVRMQEPLSLCSLTHKHTHSLLSRSLPPVPRCACVRMYSRCSMAAVSNCLLALCKVLGVAVGIDRTGQAREPGQDRAR